MVNARVAAQKVTITKPTDCELTHQVFVSVMLRRIFEAISPFGHDGSAFRVRVFAGHRIADTNWPLFEGGKGLRQDGGNSEIVSNHTVENARLERFGGDISQIPIAREDTPAIVR
jgi:hypothetical protein